MVRMFVRHSVNDYGTWRNVYDEFESDRDEMGVKGGGVFRDVGDGNAITAYHDFDSMEAAQAFAGSDRLREAMGRAGVSGPPEIWFTQQA